MVKKSTLLLTRFAVSLSHGNPPPQKEVGVFSREIKVTQPLPKMDIKKTAFASGGGMSYSIV